MEQRISIERVEQAVNIFGSFDENIRLLEELYPGKFFFHCDRDSYDYVYAIDDLAQLKGRKYQRKRNHLNRFREAHPDHIFEPITSENIAEAEALASQWYDLRLAEAPHSDFQLEQAALRKQYIDEWRENMRAMLDGVVIQRPDGTTEPLKKKAPTVKH